jgi:Na+/proline symporter
VFYQQNPDIVQPGRAKEVLSHFVTNSLPAGLKGLMLSAIILASIDSPLSSLASSFVTDIYRPLIKKAATEKHYLIISRTGVAAFGIILAAIAFACESVENILWFAFEIFSLTGGATLGIFILGVLTRRRANIGNVIAMIISTLSVTFLLLMSHKGYINLAWSWLIVIGTIITLILSCLFSCIKTKERPQ